MRWEDINIKLRALATESEALRVEWEAIKADCGHPKLPEREFGEEYRDVCPDCGFVAYCYLIGGVL